MRRTRHHHQRGFTFVEVLVVTIMIGLIAALVIPAVLGAREQATDAAAKALLRTGASAVETAAHDAQSYAGLTVAQLSQVEPTIAWTTAPGAQARDDQITISRLGPGTYTLTTTSQSGAVHVLAKDLGGSPTVTRTCGPGCSW